MSNFKRIAAAAAAATIFSSLAACGSGTAYALTINGEPIKAGVYIYFSYVAYNEAVQTLAEQDSELDTTDKEVVKQQNIDDMSTLEWIQDKALTYCKEQAAIVNKFNELDLTLSEDDVKEIDDTMDSLWDESQETFEKNGISESSVRDIMEYTYMTTDLFYYYYDIGGEEGVTEDEVHDYYVENTARVQYISFDSVDGNGESLDGSAKTKFEKMVNDYLEAVEKLSDESKIEDKMNEIQEEYNAYVTSVSEQAAAEAAATATDEDGNLIGTTTTAATTTTTAATASDGETTETTTTTTTVPYANESIISKVTTDEDTDEEDVSYTPNKTVHDFIFDEAEINKPELVSDEESGTQYLVVRYDIENRLTEDDLWTDTTKKSTISVMHNDDFQDKLDGWVEELDVVVNDAAIKRYDPFDIDFS